MNYVCDTHALVWYFTNDKRLSKRAFRAFEETIKEGLVIIPALVLAEVMYISNKGRIAISFKETLRKIKEYDNYEIAPLDIDILEIADSIDVKMEMHDKLIVASAIYFDAVLITKDIQIKKSEIIQTIW